MADLVVNLNDELLDVLVQTQIWKQLFGNCVAVPQPAAGCGTCGGRRFTLDPGSRDRVRECLLGADAGKISSLKASLGAAKLVVFTRAASGTLGRHEI